MTIPAFTAQQFREAQHRLGLADVQLARMLGQTPAQIRRMKVADPTKPSHRAVSATTARLLQAYLEGYRPGDWPVDANRRSP